MKKKVTILGSTGSIGVQTLDVISKVPEHFEILCITANNNLCVLSEQIDRFHPKTVVIVKEESYYEFIRNFSHQSCEIICGKDALINVASNRDNDLVVSALVGYSGVLPTVAALESGINVALANKETLVVAGGIMVDIASKTGAKIIAVDSEHNAILQCLAGESTDDIEKIILTASGGPFRKLPLQEFASISVEQALNHPNWSMGNKITIDSATMMNKGFEVIEAHWLFGLQRDRIEVVIHPQSIIHSFVQFKDASIKAQLGLPDMRIPISYALFYPERMVNDFPRLNFKTLGSFDFWQPDKNRYPCLFMAYDALESGGNVPAVLNASNEVCVSHFLGGKIRFIDIPEVISRTINSIEFIPNPSLDDIGEIDKISRIKSKEIIDNLY